MLSIWDPSEDGHGDQRCYTNPRQQFRSANTWSVFDQPDLGWDGRATVLINGRKRWIAGRLVILGEIRDGS
jgi:hypothetical protein